MKKMLLLLFAVIAFSVPAVASTGQPQVANPAAACSGPSPEMISMYVAATPFTLPANILASPYQGLRAGWDSSSRIKSDVGRTALRVVMAPLFVPAALLNLPSALMSPTGLTLGY